MSSLDAYVVQCQKQQTWSLCLKVLVNVTVTGTSSQQIWGLSFSDYFLRCVDAVFDADQAVAGDGSGDEGAEEMHGGAHQEDLDNMTSAVAVCVCYTYSSQRHSSMLRFTVPSSAFDDSTTLQVKQRIYLSTALAKNNNTSVISR